MRRLLVGMVLVASQVLAAERDFGLTWTSRLLAPASKEAFAAVTPHVGRVDEYTRVDVQAGFALGLAPGVESQLFFTASPETRGVEDRRAELRVSNLWRLGILPSASERALNAVAQVQVSMGPQAFAVDGRLVGELRVGGLLVALNAGITQEAFFDAHTQAGLHLEQSLAVGYGLPSGVRVGVEWVNRLGFDTQGFAGDAVSMGPSLTGRIGKVWAALAVLPQVAAFKRRELVGNGEQLELTDNERLMVRVQLGIDVP